MTTPNDPIDRLTVAELDAGNRLLQADIVGAIRGGTMERWAALAIVAWLLAKRDEPAAQLTTYRNMTPVEVMSSLGVDLDGDPVGRDAPTPPPVSEDAGEADPLDAHAADLAAEVAADPTARPRG